MKVCPDTNVLLRAVLPIDDGTEDAIQSGQAATLLKQADQIFVSLPVLCEFAWVLRSVYRFGIDEIVAAIRALVETRNVVCDRRAIELGLRVAQAGGDFADGVIAESGFVAGADVFVSFDQHAVRLVAANGRDAQVPA